MFLLFGKAGVSIQNLEDKGRWFRKKSNFLVFRHSGPGSGSGAGTEIQYFQLVKCLLDPGFHRVTTFARGS
ncbi:MAG: hypothetical protein D4R73_09015 [Deltaproteobacteria bacterium]|nr:MAG: hypothetical protein D4R73_09015 [Deltaproteobacteria bacterium]